MQRNGEGKRKMEDGERERCREKRECQRTPGSRPNLLDIIVLVLALEGILCTTYLRGYIWEEVLWSAAKLGSYNRLHNVIDKKSRGSLTKNRGLILPRCTP